MNKQLLACLKILITVTPEDEIPSKEAKNFLIEQKYAQRAHGYMWLTEKGVKILAQHGLLKEDEDQDQF